MAQLDKVKPEEVRHACAKLRAFISEGMEDAEIASSLNMTLSALELLKKTFYAAEAETLRTRSTEQIYVDYVMAQSRNIKDLTRLQSQFERDGQAGPSVSAIKARADIFDRIMDRGQELGFIDKKAETKMILGGLVVAQLSDAQLREQISQELNRLGESTRKTRSGILDIDPGPIHRALPGVSKLRKDD